MKHKEDVNLPERLLDVKAVAKLLSISTSSVWRLRDRGQLPPPIQVGRRNVRWRLSDLLEFLKGL